MQSLLTLGRQPLLGLAELESLYGAARVRLVGKQAAIVDIDPCLLAFDRLGGSIKFAKVLTTQPTTNWKQLEKFLITVGPGHAGRLPEGKMQLGLSVQGLDVSPGQLEATGLTLKKAIRKTGRSVRLIPNKTAELTTPQVIHNHLTGPTGWELLLIGDGDQTIIAQTVMVQDIASYTRRDRERPKRDAKVGMLPPKLAQLLINLAAGPLPEAQLSNICDTPAGQPVPKTILGQTVLDPFCGTGVVLQEAHLMGYDVYGTDLEPRMIDFTNANLSWLDPKLVARTETGDATNHTWTAPVDLIAGETYLGKPFTSAPDPVTLSQTASDCNTIIRKFLRNIHGQLAPGTRLCLAVPAWQTSPDHFKTLPLIDQIDDLGYNRVRFEHIRDDQLIYYRSDQLVARQLLVITTK
ncbi:MAG: DNA methyltransferase [Candidatus Saccharimonadales bacterium]